MVKGEEDTVYQRLYNKFTLLTNNEIHSNSTIIYRDTATVADFEKKNNTTVVLTPPQENKRQGAYFKLNDTTVTLSIKKDVDISLSQNLSISSCKKKNGEDFWLLHLTDMFIPVPKADTVDIDELNNDLDSLLMIK